MPNLNRVFLMGNLTRDPELRYLPNNNTPVVGIGLAVNRRWKDPQGEQKEEVTFLDCEAFGRTAEVLNQYLRKGRPVYLEGRLKLDQWKDKEGNNRSKLKVVIETFQFIDSRGGEGGPGGPGGPSEGADMNEGGPPRSARPGPPPGAPPRTNRPPHGPADQGNGGASQSGDPHQPVGEEDIPF